jgi:hypothetical protein
MTGTQVATVRLASNGCQVIDGASLFAAWKNAAMSAESGHCGYRLRDFLAAGSAALA